MTANEWRCASLQVKEAACALVGAVPITNIIVAQRTVAPEEIEAILSLLPLDTFVDDFAGRMEVDGEPDYLPPVQEDVAKIVRANDDKFRDMISFERQAFYEFARKSYAIVQTSETRLFGCFMLRKGVIFPS